MVLSTTLEQQLDNENDLILEYKKQNNRLHILLFNIAAVSVII